MHKTFRRSVRLSAAAIVTMVALATFTTGSAVQAAGLAPAAGAAGPNHFDPTSRASSTSGAPAVPAALAGTPKTPRTPERRIASALAPPVTVTLDPSKPGRVTAAGSPLEVDVPAGAVSASDVAAAGGGMSLLVRQVAPPSGGSAGGSGHATSGTFLIQVLDASGKLARQGLRQPLGVQLHLAENYCSGTGGH